MEYGNYPEKIHYAFQTEQGAQMRPAHGVWGGVTPHGEIEMCFYDESSIPPQFSEQEIGPDGLPGPEHIMGNPGERKVIRNIHSRVLLNPQTARAIMDWLEERLNELDDAAPKDMFDSDSGIRQ